MKNARLRRSVSPDTGTPRGEVHAFPVASNGADEHGLWEESPGVQRVYHVSITRLARLVGMAPDDGEWDGIVAATGELVDEARSNL